MNLDRDVWSAICTSLSNSDATHGPAIWRLPGDEANNDNEHRPNLQALHTLSLLNSAFADLTKPYLWQKFRIRSPQNAASLSAQFRKPENKQLLDRPSVGRELDIYAGFAQLNTDVTAVVDTLKHLQTLRVLSHEYDRSTLTYPSRLPTNFFTAIMRRDQLVQLQLSCGAHGPTITEIFKLSVALPKLARLEIVTLVPQPLEEVHTYLVRQRAPVWFPELTHLALGVGNNHKVGGWEQHTEMATFLSFLESAPHLPKLRCLAIRHRVGGALRFLSHRGSTITHLGVDSGANLTEALLPSLCPALSTLHIAAQDDFTNDHHWYHPTIREIIIEDEGHHPPDGERRLLHELAKWCVRGNAPSLARLYVRTPNIPEDPTIRSLTRTMAFDRARWFHKQGWELTPMPSVHWEGPRSTA